MLSRSRGRRIRDEPLNTTPADAGGLYTAAVTYVRVHVSPRTVVLVLAVLAVALTCASLAVHLVKFYTAVPVPTNLQRMFDLDRENNLPTYFSSVNLLACAALLLLIYRSKSVSKDRYTLYWAGLSLVFLYLSADEAASLHEVSVGPMQRMVGDTIGALYAAWVIPAGAAVAVFGLLYLRFLLALPRTTRNLFVGAAVLYVGGAIGGEMLSWHHRFPLHRQTPTDWEASKDLIYRLLTTGEEALEMAGVIVFLYALLSYLAAGGLTAAVRFGDHAPARCRS